MLIWIFFENFLETSYCLFFVLNFAPLQIHQTHVIKWKSIFWRRELSCWKNKSIEFLPNFMVWGICWAEDTTLKKGSFSRFRGQRFRLTLIIEFESLFKVMLFMITSPQLITCFGSYRLMFSICDCMICQSLDWKKRLNTRKLQWKFTFLHIIFEKVVICKMHKDQWMVAIAFVCFG